MAGRPRIFDLLLREENPDVDDALVAALSGSDGDTVRWIAEALLARAKPPGLHGLVANFHLFNESVRMMLLAEIDGLFRVLREASQSRQEQVRLNVVELISQGRAFRASYLLDTALHDRAAPVRVAAAEALYGLADQVLRASTPPPAGEGRPSAESLRAWASSVEAHLEDRRQIVSALEAGIVAFQVHLHPRVFEAAMWCVDDLGAKFWALAGDPSGRGHRVAFSVLRRLDDARLVPFCYGATCHASLRAYVTKFLSSCTEAPFWTEWFRQGWRLAQPRLVKGIVAVKELHCLHDSSVILSLPQDARRHAPRIVASLGSAIEPKLLQLRDLYRQSAGPMRRSVTWQLCGMTDDRVVAILRKIERDTSCDAAAIARYELARRFPSEFAPSDLLAAATRGPTALAPSNAVDFEHYWADFERYSPADRVRLGRELFAQKPARAILRHHLDAADTGSRIRALRIVATMGLAQEFSTELYRLSHDAHSEVRSAAIAALGAVANATSRLIVRGALTDPDPRVQANAVEAVEHSASQEDIAELLPMLGATDNRVRANAVKALLKLGVRQAAEALLLMLRDASRSHRISALWLVDHLGLFAISERIMGMAHSDDDPAVRTRARELADRLVSTCTGKDRGTAGAPTGRAEVAG